MSLKGYCYINPLAHSYFETSIVPWMRENEFPELVKNNTTLAIDLLPLIQTRKDESERLFSHQSFCRQLFSDIHQRWRMLQRRNHFKSAKSIVSGEFTKMFRWCNQFSRTKDAGDASIQTPSLCLEKMTFFSIYYSNARRWLDQRYYLMADGWSPTKKLTQKWSYTL